MAKPFWVYQTYFLSSWNVSPLKRKQALSFVKASQCHAGSIFCGIFLRVRSMGSSQRGRVFYPPCSLLAGLQVILAQYKNRTKIISDMFATWLIKELGTSTYLIMQRKKSFLFKWGFRTKIDQVRTTSLLIGTFSISLSRTFNLWLSFQCYNSKDNKLLYKIVTWFYKGYKQIHHQLKSTKCRRSATW